MTNHAHTRREDEKGFTLIELLIVIGIIGFLAAAVLVAVDPVKRIQDSRNARRWSEANALLNAMLNKQVDDRKLYDGETGALIITGTLPQVIVSTPTGVACATPASAPLCPGSGVLDVTAGTNCVANLSALVPTYIASLPIDPLGSGATPNTSNLALGTHNTGYYIKRTTGNRIEVGACQPEQGATISVKR